MLRPMPALARPSRRERKAVMMQMKDSPRKDQSIISTKKNKNRDLRKKKKDSLSLSLSFFLPTDEGDSSAEDGGEADDALGECHAEVSSRG